MLSKILYGTASLTHGNLKLTAVAAGPLGSLVELSISQGSPLDVAASFICPGAGMISVTAPAGTTEAQILSLLNGSASVRQLATAEIAGGDGSAAVAPLASTAFAATGGLIAHISNRLGISNWADRDQVASGAPRGMVWAKEAEITRLHPDFEDGYHSYRGLIELAVVFQSAEIFEAQNSQLDLFRRAIVAALFSFDGSALGLDSFHFPKFEFGNQNVPQSAGQERGRERADLRVNATIPLTWTEPAYLPADEITVPESQFNVGLFNEPLEDALGPGGGEVLDQPPIDAS